jgi:hypothetical protein
MERAALPKDRNKRSDTPIRVAVTGIIPTSNYELFNCSNFNIRYWSWNYRGCWPLIPVLTFISICTL